MSYGHFNPSPRRKIYWVKFLHSPILHNAFSSWIEKTMTKNKTLPLGKHICLTIVIAFNNYLQEWHAEFIQTLQVMA